MDVLKTRRRFQIRLRTILLLMVVLSVALGWVMNERRRIAERREALRGLIFVISEDMPQPHWHSFLFGDDSPGFAIGATNRERGRFPTTDDELNYLLQLTQLQTLSFDEMTANDEAALRKALPNCVIIVGLFYDNRPLAPPPWVSASGLFDADSSKRLNAIKRIIRDEQ